MAEDDNANDDAPQAPSASAGVIVRHFDDLPENHTLVPWATKAGFVGDEEGTAREPSSAKDKFEVIELIGKGAMGEVHLAQDADLLRRVAFKKLVTKGQLSSAAAARFLTEVQITAQLDHPNIVPVYGLALAKDGSPAYAMKLVKGTTLSTLLTDARLASEQGALPGPLSLATRIEHLVRVCDAVAYANAKGVVHRDLKPDNVMIGRYHEVYVMDWGIAHVVGEALPIHETLSDTLDLDLTVEAAGTRTMAGAIIGTPQYMSPEQANGRIDRIGPHSDVFSLGLVLYEIAFLRKAYTGKSGQIILDRARTADLDAFDLTPTVEPVDDDLRAIIRKATSREPSDRYRDVDSLGDDLRRYVAGQETLALPDDLPRKVRRWAAANIRLTIGIACAVVVATLVLLGWSYYDRQVDAALARVEAQQRQQDLSDFIAHLQMAAERADNEFLWYEGLLEGLSAAASHAVTSGAPSDLKAAHYTVFSDPDRAPPMLRSPFYPNRISLEAPAWKEAPDADPVAVAAALSQVVSLEPLMRSTILSTNAGEHRDILNDDPPIDWVYVALENPGLMLIYPGSSAGWTASYDPRKRPWYRETVAAHGRRVWGTPYIDLMGQGRVITCGKALMPNGNLVGVAAFDLRIDWIADKYLQAPDVPQPPDFEHLALVDRQGRVVVTSDADFNARMKVESDGTLHLPDYPNAEVVKRAKTGRSGFFEDGDELYAWAPLQHLGWTLVTRTDAAELFVTK